MSVHETSVPEDAWNEHVQGYTARACLRIHGMSMRKMRMHGMRVPKMSMSKDARDERARG